MKDWKKIIKDWFRVPANCIIVIVIFCLLMAVIAESRKILGINKTAEAGDGVEITRTVSDRVVITPEPRPTAQPTPVPTAVVPTPTPIPVFDSVTISHAISDVSEIVTNRYRYEGAGIYRGDGLVLLGQTITDKSFIVAYQGEMLIGTDFSGMTVKVNNTSKVIEVRLPEVRILSHEIKEDTLEVWDEKNSIFNPISMSDYASFFASEKERQEQNAVEFGILDQEKEQTSAAIRQLIYAIEGIKEMNYDVRVVYE